MLRTWAEILQRLPNLVADELRRALTLGALRETSSKLSAYAEGAPQLAQ